MLSNRSIPNCTVIPTLAYANVGEAIDWLSRAFGFTLRVRIHDHRAQMNVGDGAMVITEGGTPADPSAQTTHSVMVRVSDEIGTLRRAAQSPMLRAQHQRQSTPEVVCRPMSRSFA